MLAALSPQTFAIWQSAWYGWLSVHRAIRVESRGAMRHGQHDIQCLADDWSLHRKGPMDQERHNEKIKDAIKQNLADIVSEEAIILSDGKKIVKVPIRSLEEYQFRFDPGREGSMGQGNGRARSAT